MFHYIFIARKPTGEHSTTLWRVEGNTAIRPGIFNARSRPGCYYEVVEGESILEKIARSIETELPEFKVEKYKLELDLGQYYPRMSRPNDSHWHQSPGSNPGEYDIKNFIAMSLGQLTVLARQLNDICQIIHPSKETFFTYGHGIRNLLILASTEVEAHWRGILVANNYIKPTYNTNDYVMLLGAMKLDEYTVSFPSFPWLSPVRPFGMWSASKPTASLKWYDAYNAVKHNREGEFDRATLENAFEAVAACAVMLIAQFGLHFSGWPSSETSVFFNFPDLPKWTPAQVYAHPYDKAWDTDYEDSFIQVAYPFPTPAQAKPRG